MLASRSGASLGTFGLVGAGEVGGRADCRRGRQDKSGRVYRRAGASLTCSSQGFRADHV